MLLDQQLDLKEKLRRIEDEKETYQEDIKLAEGFLFDLGFEEREIERKLEELKCNLARAGKEGGGKMQEFMSWAWEQLERLHFCEHCKCMTEFKNNKCLICGWKWRQPKVRPTPLGGKELCGGF